MSGRVIARTDASDNGQQDSRLLTLPAEIRFVILAYLLDSDRILSSTPKYIESYPFIGSEDLHCHCQACASSSSSAETLLDLYRPQKHYSFHPQILRTCRKIYTEGINVLYADKTVRLTYLRVNRGNVLDCKGTPFVLGQRGFPSSLEKYPLVRNIKKWEVKVYYTPDHEDISEADDSGEYCAGVQNLIREDVDALRSLPQIDSLSISMDTTFDSLIRASEIETGLTWVVAYFSNVRARECHVEIDQLPHYCSRFKAEVERSTPAVTATDMIKACRELLAKVEALVNSTELESVDLWPAESVLSEIESAGDIYLFDYIHEIKILAIQFVQNIECILDVITQRLMKRPITSTDTTPSGAAQSTIQHEPASRLVTKCLEGLQKLSLQIPEVQDFYEFESGDL